MAKFNVSSSPPPHPTHPSLNMYYMSIHAWPPQKYIYYVWVDISPPTCGCMAVVSPLPSKFPPPPGKVYRSVLLDQVVFTSSQALQQRIDGLSPPSPPTQVYIYIYIHAGHPLPKPNIPPEWGGGGGGEEKVQFFNVHVLPYYVLCYSLPFT